MQASIFENLEHVRPAAHYSKPITRRMKILQDNIRELRKYHDKAGKQKKTIIMQMIAISRRWVMFFRMWRIHMVTENKSRRLGFKPFPSVTQVCM